MGAYTYDVNGVRYTKTADGVTTTYFYDGNTLLGENRSDGTRLRYFYDATGLCGFSYYNGSDTKYYTYVKDVLGNIVMIKDDMGLPLVKYTYNEWGICSMTAFNLDNQGAAALELGNLNPFRYRGYVYDSETGFYYLQSRYYDPETCRFLNMDSVEYADPQTLNGLNLYAYGLNNPVMFLDPTGHFVISLGLALLIGFVVGAAVGFGATVYTDYKDDGEVFNGSVSAGEYIGNTLIGGAVGTAAAGLIYTAPSIGAAISSAFNSAPFAMATGGSAVVGLTAEQMAALGLVIVSGYLFFAKDPYVEKLKKGMSPNQKQKFKEEIEEYKRTEGRGGDDNLSKELLEEIAEFIKTFFT